MRRTCTKPGCDRPAYGRGLCSKHYQHAKYHGQLPAVLPTRTCERCGKEFAARKWNARFCSRECVEAAHHERRRNLALEERGERRCLNCNRIIPPKVTLKAKCCSPKCSEAWQNKRRADAKRAEAEARYAAWAAETRYCARGQCGKKLPVPAIGQGRHLTKYCSPECRKKDAAARWRMRSPHYMRQYLYGLTRDQFEALLAAQDSRCAICGSPDWPAPVKSGSPQVDHDHGCDQGHVSNRACASCARGLLCGHCNTGIGHLGHDPARLRAAADYLDKFT